MVDIFFQIKIRTIYIEKLNKFLTALLDNVSSESNNIIYLPVAFDIPLFRALETPELGCSINTILLYCFL